MKNVLITGGAGFIGSRIALKLLEMDANVTILDNLAPQIHGTYPDNDSDLYQSIKEKVTFLRGDVGDEKMVKEAIEGVDEIYHLAAETGTGQSMYEINNYFRTNVQGTATLLNILANSSHGVKKILVASSRAVYGEGKYSTNNRSIVYPKSRLISDMESGIFNLRDDLTQEELILLPTDESSCTNPTSIYGITKLYQEDMIMKIAPTYGIDAVAVRYQNVYGPGQSLSNPYTGILAIFSTRILNGNPIEIFEDGLESRDFIYIDDVVDATILTMNHSNSCNNIYNIGSGIAIPVTYIADKLLNLYGKIVDVNITGKFRVGDIRHNLADISKIKKLINFTPEVSFDEGLERFVNWVKTQKVQKDKYEESMNELKSKGMFK